ncbi:MAG: hypothetical protein ACR2J6_04330 [Thermoleophilaceae bacterium]
MRDRFLHQLRSSLASAAVPYGYTLTIFASGAITGDLLGSPHAPQVLIFVAGAVAAFTSLEAVVHRSGLVVRHAPDAHSTAIWGHAHLLAAGLAIGAVWLADGLLAGSALAWPVAGFLSTGLYLVLATVQAIAAQGRGR